jgi:hypothetical protein
MTPSISSELEINERGKEKTQRKTNIYLVFLMIKNISLPSFI